MTDQFKNCLRTTYREIRENLPKAWQRNLSSRICSRIRSMDPYRHAKRIAIYHACNGEVSLEDLWGSAPMQGKFCYFPVINSENKLSFLPATPGTPFKNNRYGIPEPDVDLSQAIPASDINLILMPLVVFDSNCTRIGMGGGYYDRTLAKENHPMLIGVAYEFQRQTWLLPDEWDIPLTAVVTEKMVYWP